MKLWRRFGASWDRLGRDNAFGAILTKDGKIADWSADEFWTTGRIDVERFMTELSRLVPDAPRTRALDFGCGVGRISAALAEHYGEVVGVDVARSMVARARALVAEPRCTFVLNQAPHLRQFKDAALPPSTAGSYSSTSSHRSPGDTFPTSSGFSRPGAC